MAPNTSRLLSGWRIQGRTMHALLVRDLMMRYGRDNVGFVWVVLEPMILCVGVMFIWSILGNHGKDGIKIVELVLTGYMPLTLWRHLTGPVIGMFRNNASLIYHRRVSLLDLVLSRQCLEIIGSTTALLIIYVFLLSFGLADGVRRLDLVILGWLMMAWIGVAFGALLACWTERHDVLERFVQPLQYLNLPISGAFFLVDWLPHWAQNVILYHPLVHCWEVFRAGYFGETIVSHYDLAYFTACAFGFSFWALHSIRRIRAHVRLA